MDQFTGKDYVPKQTDGGLNGGLKSLPGTILNYPDFKSVEFDGFGKHFQDEICKLDSNSPEFEGIENGSNVSQLVCLSNLDSLNALFY